MACSSQTSIDDLTNHLLEVKQESSALTATTNFMQYSVDYLLETNVHFAVIGPSGCGKTEFTQQFLRLEDDENCDSGPGIDNRTLCKKTFTHPTCDNIKVDDIPGIGYGDYDDISVDEYWGKLELEKYDAYVLMGIQRFRKEEVKLYKKIRDMSKPVVMVLTHFDQFEEKMNRKRSHSQKLSQSQLKADLERYLERAELAILRDDNVRLYFVDTRYVDKYDFKDLIIAILEDLPYKIQRLTAISSIFQPSPMMIERQAEAMRNMARYISFASAVSGMIIIPGVDIALDAALIAKMFTKYRNAFNLNLEAIQQLCHHFGILEEEAEGIMSKLKHPQLLTAESIKSTLLNKDGFVKILKTLALPTLTIGLSASDDFIKAIPVIGAILGPIIGAPAGYATTLLILRRLIDMFENDAKTVLSELERLAANSNQN